MNTRDCRIVEVVVKLLVPVDIDAETLKERIDAALYAAPKKTSIAWAIDIKFTHATVYAIPTKDRRQEAAAAVRAAMGWSMADDVTDHTTETKEAP
jgi:hypothetical protein